MYKHSTDPFIEIACAKARRMLIVNIHACNIITYAKIKDDVFTLTFVLFGFPTKEKTYRRLKKVINRCNTCLAGHITPDDK